MKNKIVKIIMLISIICVIPIMSFAAPEGVASVFGDVVSDGDAFLGQSEDNVLDVSKLESFSKDVSNMILSIGMVIAVVVGICLGIKFMISSVEEKAKVKEILIVYGVGCTVLFGAFVIWKVVVNLLRTV